MSQPPKTTNKTPIRDAVWKVLHEHGPLPAAEVADYLGWTEKKVRGVICSTRHIHPKLTFRIVAYRSQPVMQAGRLIAVFAAEPGDDVKRPRQTKASANLRFATYRERNRAKIRAADSIRRNAEPLVANPWNGLLPSAKWEKVK